MPMFETMYLYGEIRKYNTCLELAARTDGQNSSTVRGFRGNPKSLSGMSKDSTFTLLLNGNLVVEDSITRPEIPLSIAATGSITLKRNTILRGLILISSTNQIVIEEGAVLDHVICYSERSIEVQNGSTLSAQLIAPVIRVGKECMLKYPSVLLSTDINSPDTSHQDISISSGSRIEGTVALLSSSSTPDQGLNRRIIDLKAGASVTGSVYSQGTVTLDGIVTGMVQAKDFYFYAAPTSYLGWLRNARIDRSGLPKSYLLPPGFSAAPKLDVLDWL
jgi:cytoskeletal protein CcmA (bactofilin family)